MKDNNNNNKTDDILHSGVINVETFEKVLGVSNDIVYKKLYIHDNKKLPVTLIFVDGLTDVNKVSDFIVKPINTNDILKNAGTEKIAISKILDGAAYFPTTKVLGKLDEAIKLLMSGFSLLVFDKEQKAIAFETRGYEIRSLGESKEEGSEYGSKLGFVENLRTNTSLVRLIIKSPDLIVEETSFGTQTNTQVSVLYMKNICNTEFVRTVKNRLNELEVDRITFLSDIVPHLSDNKFTLFPLVQSTEKPDAVAASLLEGKVCVIVDGLPYGLISPVVIADMFQTTTEYGTNYIISSLFRSLTYVLFFVSILLPGFYVALTRFHTEMIPRSLLYAIAASKADTPFPIYVEILFMIFTFFTLIQASMRIPASINATISIVGGLVLGEAAINAKLVSPGVIVVIAGSAVASLAIPNKQMNYSLWVCLLINVLLGTVLGLFGIAIGFLVMLYHFSSLESLGVPYLSPFAGARKFQIDDSFIILPQFLMKFRPHHLKTKNKKRQS